MLQPVNFQMLLILLQRLHLLAVIDAFDRFKETVIVLFIEVIRRQIGAIKFVQSNHPLLNIRAKGREPRAEEFLAVSN